MSIRLDNEAQLSEPQERTSETSHTGMERKQQESQAQGREPPSCTDFYKYNVSAEWARWFL